VEVKLISDDVIQIQPQHDIEMSKPIAHQAKLANTQLGKMVKAHQKGTIWLSIVSTLVFAGGPTHQQEWLLHWHQHLLSVLIV
jgi:hypothetical protein